MIDISNLTFGYSKQALLFKNLSLQLKRGHIYGLLGENGAGKSSLLKNLCGLVFPKDGHCKVNGQDSAKRDPSFLQELFFVPEELYIPSATAAKLVTQTGQFYPKFDVELYYKILWEFNVPKDHVLDKLSYGQQKKVMIAFGLATNTSLLILDEPTNGLDIPSKAQFRKVIASALTDDRCIIISTHQVRDLDSLIDTLLVLHRQEIVLNKSMDEIADRILFTTKTQANEEAILYTLPNTMGVNTISLNNGKITGKIDMELLFNAIISGDQSIVDILR